MGVISRRRGFAAVAVVAAAALVAAGCSKSDTASGDKKITLTVTVYGEFGYETAKAGLYDKYMQTHPNITIKEIGEGQQLGDENTKLDQTLAAGAGAGDIVALEEGTITKYKGLAQDFVDLNNYGGAALKDNFLPWKFQEGTTSDGKLLGLGTDVGSMGICYRTDMFAAAGLPTDRTAVGNLWPTWQAYLDQGVKFAGSPEGSKAKWVDAATNLYNNILMQVAGANTGYTYFDKSNNLVLSSNPDIKTAYDMTTKAISQGLSAGEISFSDEWTAGFKNSKFATIACPAWMLANIQENSGDGLSGKWDIAKAPGDGGNWGGSFLSVTKQSKHPAEAADLVKFLTSPESQLAVFEKLGNLPSSPKDYDDPTFQAFKNPYFSNAPTGQIFGAGAEALKPVYLGAKNNDVRTAVEATLQAVEQKKKTPDQAWQLALSSGAAAAK
ncbi:ABC transporter substrate-binding protein [Rugosimonospora acidiphila]|uniref:ABC transporter substrate-binding protein n=1 Tax=Rugosimonospora acidiphila TaxID=556531 RepID=A0ABP9RP13_9ACTN